MNDIIRYIVRHIVRAGLGNTHRIFLIYVFSLLFEHFFAPSGSRLYHVILYIRFYCLHLYVYTYYACNVLYTLARIIVHRNNNNILYFIKIYRILSRRF